MEKNQHIHQVAWRLEQIFQGVNRSLLATAGVPAELVVDGFFKVQSELLNFDKEEKLAFETALEEQRVRSLACQNIFMACVLSSAVALSQFKKKPRSTRRGIASIGRFLQRYSTNPLTLLAFSSTSMQALIARGLLDNWRAMRRPGRHSRN